jgi:hypothetical protein
VSRPGCNGGPRSIAITGNHPLVGMTMDEPMRAIGQPRPSRQDLDSEATRPTTSGTNPTERKQGQDRLVRLRRECL